MLDSICWGTEQEKEVVDYLLKDSKRGNGKIPTKEEKKERLRGYINSCYSRAVWGGIDKKEVELYAQNKLANME